MVYSIDKESTLEKMNDIHELASSLCDPKPIFFLVGNKVDLDGKGMRAVSKKDAEEIKDDLEIEHFMETNAHDQTHILDLFTRVKNEL